MSGMEWAAGLFEGEGSIEVNLPPAARVGVRLHLNTTDLDVLERFQAIVGCGNIREVKAPSVVKPHWKTCWSWRANKQADCARLLTAWLPHLGQRRGARAQEALDLLEAKAEARYRTCYCGKHYQFGLRGGQVYCSSACRLAWNRELAKMEQAVA